MTDWWHNYPWRQIQTNLRQIDMRDISAEQVVADLQEFKATLLMINAAGIIASYPTQLPFHYQSPYVYAQYAAAAQPRLKLIPPHNFGPPERCYYELVTGHPGLVVHLFGRGKGIYIPWEPGALFHRQGYSNTLDFAADVLASFAGLEPVGGNLPPMVEVTWFEQADTGRRLLHLVNISGHFGVSFYAPLPMHNLEVTLPCPDKPSTARSLADGQPIAFDWRAGQLTLQVAELGLFQAIEVS